METVLPNHIAIIPDGNRRWAQEKGLPTLEGHRRGFEVALRLSSYLRKKGIHTLTIWAFSTENWTRTKEEVGYLMKLYERMVDKHLEEALKDKVRTVHLGRKDRLPSSLLKKIQNVEEKTKDFDRNVLNIALDYGGRDEIVRGIHKIQELNFDPKKITIENFADFLDTAHQPHPNPDLIIRTSGEKRLSGLMPWQAVYSEFLFLDKYFPDLNEEDMDNALEEYNRRQRRFGK